MKGLEVVLSLWNVSPSYPVYRNTPQYDYYLSPPFIDIPYSRTSPRMLIVPLFIDLHFFPCIPYHIFRIHVSCRLPVAFDCFVL